MGRLGAVVCNFAIVALVAAAVAGCGSSGPAPPALGPLRAAAHCEIPIPGASSDEIHIETSGISCAAAVSVALLLTSGQPTQRFKAGNVVWTCVRLPRSKLPLVARCRHDWRHFTLERGAS